MAIPITTALQPLTKSAILHGLTGQLNFIWSRSFDTGSANRGGTFLSDYQNPYDVNKDYAPANFDTPWNVNFTLVYEVPWFTLYRSLIGEGWSINSLFRAQEGRPFTSFIRGDPSNQGLRSTYADYDGRAAELRLPCRVTARRHFFNTAAFSAPADWNNW